MIQILNIMLVRVFVNICQYIEPEIAAILRFN